MTTTNATSSAGRINPRIFMPTQERLVSAYRAEVDAREKDGKLVALKHAPANAEKYPSYNISEGEGVGRTAYAIKGQLYVKSEVVGPNAKPEWFKAGPVPMF